MRRVYLDHSATTPLAPEVLDAMRQHLLENFGNASSVHQFGREARLALEESRERIAKFIGAKYDELYFTSGGTESDNYALKGVLTAAQKMGKNHLIISAVEHHAVIEPAEQLRDHGAEVMIVPVDEFGTVDVESIKRAVTPRTCLISVMHANNEVGTIQPVKSIGELARERGIVFHSDAVQTLGKIPIDVREWPVDLLSFSAHKLYGPKGVGAIFIRKGTRIDSFIIGGAQESNRRAGTENIAGAVGFAKAVELCSSRMSEDDARFRTLNQYLKEKLASSLDGVLFNGHPTELLPQIVSISFNSRHRAMDGEALIMGMDLRGVAVTSGSACTSGSLQPSHVLLAMGRDEKTARATIRFSMGRSTTTEDLDYAVDAIREVVATAQRHST